MNKKNLPLIIAVALPIMFVLSIFVLSKVLVEKIDLQYDFVYAFDNNCPYASEFRYNNVNGKLVKTPNVTPQDANVQGKMLTRQIEPKLYYYSLEKDVATALTEKEISELKNLESGQVSSDGYTVKYNYDNYSTPFFYDGRSSYYSLVKGDKKFKTSIEPNYTCGGSEIEILGWVKNN